MVEINNTASLLQQMQQMQRAAGGQSVETEGNGVQFNQLFKNAMDEVNGLMQNTESLRSRFETGDKQVSVSDVMIASQKSSVGFQALVQVRNKLVQAYEDIMNMPV